VGLGRIGRVVAKRATALGMKVVAFDPFVVADSARDLEIDLQPMDEVLARADFLTVHTPLTAETRGAAGILMFSDPALDGGVKGATYPDGPWGPESRIERGGIAYDFLAPGDPLTPGWASTPGARRLAARDAVSLPRIVSAPLSFRDARVILDALEGPEVPAAWRREQDAARRAGAGPAVVRLKVRTDDRIRPVWTVTATIRGSEQPDDVVIVGNHRDAWVYGGVDPGSGSAALVELARTLGDLQRSGLRPRRTILFASWDAE